jgi:hypothetical protein
MDLLTVTFFILGAFRSRGIVKPGIGKEEHAGKYQHAKQEKSDKGSLCHEKWYSLMGRR